MMSLFLNLFRLELIYSIFYILDVFLSTLLMTPELSPLAPKSSSFFSLFLATVAEPKELGSRAINDVARNKLKKLQLNEQQPY